MTRPTPTPTPANLPGNPAHARSLARITRPILTLSGPRPKTPAEIIAAAKREAASPASPNYARTAGTIPARMRALTAPKTRKIWPARKPRPQFGLTP